MSDLRSIFRAAKRIQESLLKTKFRLAFSELNIRVADATRGLHVTKSILAGNVKKQRFEKYTVKRLTNYLDTLLNAIATTRTVLSQEGLKNAEIPTLRFIVEELLHSAYEFKGLNVHLGNRPGQTPTLRPYVSIVTEPIVLEKVPLGRFELQIFTDTLTQHNFTENVERSIHAVALDANLSYKRQFPHPHIDTSGNICTGEGKALIARSLREGRFSDAFQLLHSVLNSYNARSAYQTIETWQGVRKTCVACGQTEYEEEMVLCPRCRTIRYCANCVSICKGCRCSTCPQCFVACRNCTEPSCLNCRRNCNSCALSGCATCVFTCDRCLRGTCKTCQSIITNTCGHNVCSACAIVCLSCNTMYCASCSKFKISNCVTCLKPCCTKCGTRRPGSSNRTHTVCPTLITPVLPRPAPQLQEVVFFNAENFGLVPITTPEPITELQAVLGTPIPARLIETAAEDFDDEDDENDDDDEVENDEDFDDEDDEEDDDEIG